jgi:predicted ATPase
MINHLHIENFRSIKNVDLEIGNLSFYCGPNGSGKSNFVEALDFLAAAFNRGLSYAVAEKGGFYNMCYRKERRSRGAIVFHLKGTTQDRGWTLRHSVRFTLQTKGQTIRSDFFVESEEYQFVIEAGDKEIPISFVRGKERYEVHKPEFDVSELTKLNPIFTLLPMFENGFPLTGPRNLLFPAPFEGFFPFAEDLKRLTSIKVLRVNPRTARESSPPSVLGELGKFGENLPSALDYLANDHPDLFAELVSVVKDVIPGLTQLKTTYTPSRQMTLFLQEEGFGTPWGTEEISDGTIISIALFFILLDPRYQMVIVEEPENSLHPWILRKFLERCRERSSNSQVLLTTQSPLVVAAAKPEELFLVEKYDAKTEIIPALQRDDLLPEILRRQFLDLGNYWLSGGIGAVPRPRTQQKLFEVPES